MWMQQPLVAADYSPDMPSLGNPGSDSIINCIPKTPVSYGPFASIQPFGGALPSRCQGAFACSDASDNNYVFAGNSTDLYEYSSASATATNVSKTSGGYNCQTDGYWKYALFGGRAIATDFIDPIQAFVFGGSKFGDLANGNITALTTTPGANYTNGTFALTVTNGGSGTGFTGTVAIAGGQITGATITTPGALYAQTSTIAIPSGANPGGIASLTLVPGSGYTNGTYALTVSGAGLGSGFAGTVTVAGGVLSSFNITNKGLNYPLTATIAIPAGAGGGTGGSITPVFATGGSITVTAQTIAPHAKFTDVAKDFLVCGYTSDPVGGTQAQRVWWSALNDPTNWPTPGTTLGALYQSSYNDLFGNGGSITGVVGNLGTADFAVFLEHEVWRAVYSGPPVIFSFSPAEGVRGTRCPNSLIHLGALVYYLGEDGFYVFDGTTSTPIGVNKVDKTFYANFDQNYQERVWGAADPLNKVVYWLYPSTSATNGIPDSMIMYNWQLEKWSSAQITAETIFRAITFGYTLDTMPGPLDALTVPLDSRAWTGGSLLLAGFNSGHALSYFNGPNLQAIIETSESAPFDDSFTFINNTRPLIDGGNPTVAVATRNRLVDMAVYNSPTTLNGIGTCPQRANGRYIKAKITIPAGTSWTHFQGIEVDANKNGVR